MRILFFALPLLFCSPTSAGLFGPSNSDECIFDGMEEAGTAAEMAALKFKCERKYDYEDTDIFSPLLESCGFELDGGGWWLPKKVKGQSIANLKSATMDWPRGQGDYGWVTLYNANDFGIHMLKIRILDSSYTIVAKFKMVRVQGIGGDVNYKFGSQMPFAGEISNYLWDIDNIELRIGDANLYLLAKEQDWCGQ